MEVVDTDGTTTFAECGLSDSTLLANLARMGVERPNVLQRLALPVTLGERRSAIITAETGR